MALNGLICADVPLRNYSLTHPFGPYESINCDNRGIGRRNNMPARLFLINNAFSAASKLRTPNMYCSSRKTLVAI